MWKEAVAETGIIFYLMLGVGIVGILAKDVYKRQHQYRRKECSL